MYLEKHIYHEQFAAGDSVSMNINDIVIYIIRLNGIYDIVCALAILNLLYIPVLRELHLGMLITRGQSLSYEQYFAYWVFTYGVIRLCSTDISLISYSYYIEAAFVAFECFVKKTMVYDKSIFVIITSVLLGYLCQLLVIHR